MGGRTARRPRLVARPGQHPLKVSCAGRLLRLGTRTAGAWPQAGSHKPQGLPPLRSASSSPPTPISRAPSAWPPGRSSGPRHRRFPPLAIGVAVSPLPIMAVVLMLATPRARTNAFAFVLGWLIGLGLVGTVVLLAGLSGPGTSLHPATWTSWLKIGFGALLLTAGVRLFHHRPRPGTTARVPKWVGRIDHVGRSQPRAGQAAPANPMNLLLCHRRSRRGSHKPASPAPARPSPTPSSPRWPPGLPLPWRYVPSATTTSGRSAGAQGLDDPVQRRHLSFLLRPGRVALLAHD